MRIDSHQHLWPEPLLAALSARRQSPRVSRARSGWILHVADRPPAPLEATDHDPERRAALLRADGLDRALLALAGLGVESLPAAEAEPLVAAFHAGVAELEPAFGAWAAVSLDAEPASLEAALDAGFAGLCLTAEALGSPAAADRCAPFLELLVRHERPLFVHPGIATSPPGTPAWWPALTGEVAALGAAWHVVHSHVLPTHPALRVCFAALAGLAPLHGERLGAHGAAAEIAGSVFVETSSYGVRAVDACVRALGVDALVHGSDRPALRPQSIELGAALDHALTVANPARLLNPVEVPHDRARQPA